MLFLRELLSQFVETGQWKGTVRVDLGDEFVLAGATALVEETNGENAHHAVERVGACGLHHGRGEFVPDGERRAKEYLGALEEYAIPNA